MRITIIKNVTEQNPAGEQIELEDDDFQLVPYSEPGGGGSFGTPAGGEVAKFLGYGSVVFDVVVDGVLLLKQCQVTLRDGQADRLGFMHIGAKSDPADGKSTTDARQRDQHPHAPTEEHRGPLAQGTARLRPSRRARRST
ncbi:MAG TPA: hypothetical protein VF316_12180 [Polyangiaceae bacterium]